MVEELFLNKDFIFASQGPLGTLRACVRNEVDLVPLACEDTNIYESEKEHVDRGCLKSSFSSLVLYMYMYILEAKV